jgi:hypothetical protein
VGRSGVLAQTQDIRAVVRVDPDRHTWVTSYLPLGLPAVTGLYVLATVAVLVASLLR